MDSEQVTKLLQAMRGGDASAAETLLPMIYGELHRLAKAYMRRERPEHTLQPTALINEAYLRLAHEQIDWKNREHFIALAANVMRRVLIDYARAHRAEIRGGGLKRVEMHDELAISEVRLDEVLQLDDALSRLAEQHPRQARIVELRYLGGLSIEEVASLMNIAPRSVKRDWALARIWLLRRLRPKSE